MLACIQCLCMIWGCKPNTGVAANSKMVSEICKRFLTYYNRFTMELAFPECLRDLEGEDASFEVVTSQTILPLVLIYSHRVATKTIAVIFL